MGSNRNAPRYAKRRDDNEGEIVRALRQAGVDVFHLERPVDLLVEFRGEYLLLEVKMPDGTLTDDQKDFFARTKGPCYVVRGVGEALDVIAKRRKKHG